MIKFDKPINLNGAELLDELKAENVKVTGFPLIDEYGDFWLNIDEKDKVKAAKVIATHDGTTVAKEPTVDEKLSSVGLSIDDLKAALGL